MLAHALATDDNPADSTPWTTWDTSGDSTGLEGHVIQSPVDCSAEPASEAGVPSEPIGDDNGDNCTGGGPDGSFSTVFGTLSPAGSTIGPFDPVDGTDTLLSDGILNSQDAPMPAARIDVAIAPNSGGATDISGVGSLKAADKTKTYSRDFPRRQLRPQPLRALLRRVHSCDGSRGDLLGRRRGLLPITSMASSSTACITSGIPPRWHPTPRARPGASSARGTRRPTARCPIRVTTTRRRRVTPTSRCTPIRTVRLRCGTTPEPGSTSTASSIVAVLS